MKFPSHLFDFLQKLAALDDSSLVKLSSVGLLRRAKKDAENSASWPLTMEGNSLQISLPDAMVTLSGDDLRMARCTCSASEMCRHRLATVILLRQKWADGAFEAVTSEAISPAKPKNLRRPRKAVAELSSPRSSESTAPLTPEKSPLSREQQRSLIHLEQTLQQTLQYGLDRLSPLAEQQFLTLSNDLHVVNLPRLSQLSLKVAEEIGAQQRSLASADSEVLLYDMSLLFALKTALQHCTDADIERFAGVHRRRYTPLEPLELWGCGLWKWRTASGFHGVTLALLDPLTGHMWRWSDSRPCQQSAGFSPTQRYHQPAPWQPHLKLSEMARRIIWLDHPHGAGERLSASKTTEGRDMGPLNGHVLPAHAQRNWRLLAQKTVKTWPIGLQTRGEPALAWLIPTRWGTPYFDAIEQRFYWPIFDENDDEIRLQMAYLPELQKSLARLTQLDPQGIQAVLALNSSVNWTDWRPVTLLTHDSHLIHLDFEELPPALKLPSDQQWLDLPTLPKTAPAHDSLDVEIDPLNERSLSPSNLNSDPTGNDRVLDQLLDQLRLIAERGGLTGAHRERLARFPNLLQQRACDSLIYTTQELLRSEHWMFPLLKLFYLLQLHAQIRHRQQAIAQ